MGFFRRRGRFSCLVGPHFLDVQFRDFNLWLRRELPKQDQKHINQHKFQTLNDALFKFEWRATQRMSYQL